MHQKVIFLCHGNICRSPMAEFILKDLVRKKGLEKDFFIDSGAVSREEIGNPLYPPAHRKLAEHGIAEERHAARQITPEEFDAFDRVIVMDRSNLRLLAALVGPERVENREKVHLLMEFAAKEPLPREAAPDVADPWYTGDFEITYRDLVAGCGGLLDFLTDDSATPSRCP